MRMLDDDTARAVFKLIDSVSLVRLIRDESLQPKDVERLMDLWKVLEPQFAPRPDHG